MSAGGNTGERAVLRRWAVPAVLILVAGLGPLASCVAALAVSQGRPRLRLAVTSRARSKAVQPTAGATMASVNSATEIRLGSSVPVAVTSGVLAGKTLTR